MAKYTKEEKNVYFREVRASWKWAKEEADVNKIQDLIDNHGLGNISVTGFAFVLQQMEDLGLTGLPYVDMKTYKGWKEVGHKVKKGEKSKVKGITWIGTKKEDDGDSFRSYPKVYHLFHTNQTEEI